MSADIGVYRVLPKHISKPRILSNGSKNSGTFSLSICSINSAETQKEKLKTFYLGRVLAKVGFYVARILQFFLFFFFFSNNFLFHVKSCFMKLWPALLNTVIFHKCTFLTSIFSFHYSLPWLQYVTHQLYASEQLHSTLFLKVATVTLFLHLSGINSLTLKDTETVVRTNCFPHSILLIFSAPQQQPPSTPFFPPFHHTYGTCTSNQIRSAPFSLVSNIFRIKVKWHNIISIMFLCSFIVKKWCHLIERFVVYEEDPSTVVINRGVASASLCDKIPWACINRRHLNPGMVICREREVFQLKEDKMLDWNNVS